jgi:hypothetical protein
MNITYQLFNVGVVPNFLGHANVVRSVRWGVTWEESGVSSVASVETILPFDHAASFRPIESLNKDDVISWAIEAQGGQDFIDRLAQYHVPDLAHKVASVGVVDYDGHFQLDNAQTTNTSEDVALAPIFPTPATGAISSAIFE